MYALSLITPKMNLMKTIMAVAAFALATGSVNADSSVADKSYRDGWIFAKNRIIRDYDRGPGRAHNSSNGC